jgi:signal transduction histidine kinase
MGVGFVTDMSRVTEQILGMPQSEKCDELQDQLARLREEFEQHGNVEFRTVVEGTARVLRPEADRMVRGVCREALSNVYRHANASCVELELVYRRRDLRVIVRDDGVGMSSGRTAQDAAQGMGLVRMKERAEGAGGKLRVLSQAGVGTEVEMTVPGAIAFAQGTETSWLSKVYFAREQEYV